MSKSQTIETSDTWTKPYLDLFGHNRPFLRSVDQHKFPQLLVLLQEPQKSDFACRTGCFSALHTRLIQAMKEALKQPSATFLATRCSCTVTSTAGCPFHPRADRTLLALERYHTMHTSGVQAPFLISSWQTAGILPATRTDWLKAYWKCQLAPSLLQKCYKCT